MTYNMFGGTLNLAQFNSITYLKCFSVVRENIQTVRNVQQSSISITVL